MWNLGFGTCSITPTGRLARLSVPTAVAVLAVGAAGAHAATTRVPCEAPALIAAIAATNATPEADTLTLAPGCVYTLSAPNTATDGLPLITGDVTLDGRGATIRRAASAPAFRI